MSIRKLTEMKKRVDQAKTGRDKAIGAIATLTARLKEEFDCPDLKAAEKKLKALDKEVLALDKKIDKAIAELEENYEWD